MLPIDVSLWYLRKSIICSYQLKNDSVVEVTETINFAIVYLPTSFSLHIIISFSLSLYYSIK